MFPVLLIKVSVLTDLSVRLSSPGFSVSLSRFFALTPLFTVRFFFNLISALVSRIFVKILY